MTRIHKTSTAVILAIAALGLGACGDDNKSSTGGDSATNDAIATDATGGTTGTGTGTDKTGTNGSTGKTGTSKSTSDDKGGSGGSGGGSGNDGSSGSGGGGGSGGGSGGGNGGGNGRNRDTPEKELTGKNVKSTAKTVCTSFLPTALERDLKSGKKSAEDIAKDYSRAFPTAERKDAYDGCLAGLKTKD